MALPVETDVLIVGAGPTGLALAVSLAQLGVDHVLVDRDPGPHVGSNAAAMQPRTLEYLERLDLAQGLLADGLARDAFRFQDGEQTLLRVSGDRLDTPFPFPLMVPQRVTEAHLERRLTELGGVIHRGHWLVSSQLAFPGVCATVAGPDGTLHAVQARYLVGCDGVHSAVRAAAGIAFPGRNRPQLFAMADVRLSDGSGNAEARDATFFSALAGMLLILPLPAGVDRIVAPVPPGTAAPSASDLDALLANRAGGEAARVHVSEVLSSSTYRVQERVATRFSDGPVFLAGDAAHRHSPMGGQGMNTGIQDAANLAWKLHEVIVGGGPAELLDTYHRERHPVATALVAFTSQLMTLASLADPASRQLRNEVIRAAATHNAIDWLARRLSQLDVSYAEDRSGPPPRVGQRVAPTLVPPDGLRWTLAVPADTAEPMTNGRPSRLAVRVVEGLDATLLIRPDGYLAARGVPSDPSAVLPRLAGYALGLEPASDAAQVVQSRTDAVEPAQTPPSR